MHCTLRSIINSSFFFSLVFLPTLASANYDDSSQENRYIADSRKTDPKTNPQGMNQPGAPTNPNWNKTQDYRDQNPSNNPGAYSQAGWSGRQAAPGYQPAYSQSGWSNQPAYNQGWSGNQPAYSQGGWSGGQPAPYGQPSWGGNQQMYSQGNWSCGQPGSYPSQDSYASQGWSDDHQMAYSHDDWSEGHVDPNSHGWDANHPDYADSWTDGQASPYDDHASWDDQQVAYGHGDWQGRGFFSPGYQSNYSQSRGYDVYGSDNYYPGHSYYSSGADIDGDGVVEPWERNSYSGSGYGHVNRYHPYYQGYRNNSYQYSPHNR